MSVPTLEDVYAALAEGVDRSGPEHEAMFLSKVCLLLAHDLDDPAKVLARIKDAQINMKAMRPAVKP